jgi:hypothetical protein
LAAIGYFYFISILLGSLFPAQTEGIGNSLYERYLVEYQDYLANVAAALAAGMISAVIDRRPGRNIAFAAVIGLSILLVSLPEITDTHQPMAFVPLLALFGFGCAWLSRSVVTRRSSSTKSAVPGLDTHIVILIVSWCLFGFGLLTIPSSADDEISNNTVSTNGYARAAGLIGFTLAAFLAWRSRRRYQRAVRQEPALAQVPTVQLGAALDRVAIWLGLIPLMLVGSLTLLTLMFGPRDETTIAVAKRQLGGGSLFNVT